jgi:DNA invertase Pin-like site-specific DNA recombinase
MIVAYARTSTVEQVAGFESQLKELKAAGCEKFFQEQVSSVVERKELDAAMAFVREGDVFVVTKLDRLARSIVDLLTIVEQLETKKVTLKILNLGVDTGNATGKLILSVLGSIAQFERQIMLERQKDGIAKAKLDKKYKGRKPLSDERRANVIKMSGAGVTRSSIAKQLGIGEASVYRILATQKGATPGRLASEARVQEAA